MSSVTLAGRKGIRSDFKGEVARVVSAIKDCDKLEREIAALLQDQLVPSLVPGRKPQLAAGRGGSLYVRLTEQRLSNRLQKHHLIRLLWDMKRDVVGRDLKIAVTELQAEAVATADAAGSAVTAALLTFLQTGGVPLHRPSLLLEPGEYEEVAPDGAPTAEEAAEEEDGGEIAISVPDVPAAPLPPAWPDGLPEDVAAGDIVSDASGALWTVREDSCERLGLAAAEVVLDHPSGAPPFARLSDGRLVLVMEVS
jgi:hypothetical protein